MMTFTAGSIALPYCRSGYNKAYENERAVEVPLGFWFLEKFNHNVLEVGCVLPYYLKDPAHKIIDLTDVHPRNIKANALDWDYKNKNVLCISTIEHLQKKEYDNGSDQDAIKLFELITNNADNWLITFPPTYHPILDTYIRSQKDIQRIFLQRINWENEWVTSVNENGWDVLFGHRDGRASDGVFNNANIIVVVTNQQELLSYE